jgi:transposase
MVQPTINVRERAIGMFIAGHGSVWIGDQLAVPDRTIRRWIGRFRERGNVERVPGSGRPRKTTARADRQLVRWARSLALRKRSSSSLLGLWRERVSKFTVLRRISERGVLSRIAAKKIRLTARHRQARMTWAMNHNLWPDATWRRVVWSDESRYLLHPTDGRVRVWRERGQRYAEGNVQETVAAGGGSVHVWAAIWSNGRSELVILERNVNGQTYRQTLEEFLATYGAQLGDPATWFFQDDNAPPHRTAAVIEYKRAEGLRSLPWPACSPDLNPIEHAWDYLGRRVMERTPESLRQLRDILREEWRLIPQEYFNDLIGSIHRRIGAVIEAEGGHTRY